MSYKRIKSSEIDSKKWDLCTKKTGRYRLYAQIWFLDLVCINGWEALIWDDYRAVFPMPKAKKLYLSFLDNPNLLQQIDVYGELFSDEKQEFQNFIRNQFDFIVLSTTHKIFDTNLEKINLVLNVNSYLTSKPSSTLRNNLKKASNNNLQLSSETGYKNGLLFLKQYFHLTGHNPDNKEWNFYESIMKACEKNGKGRFQFVMKDGKPVQFSFWIVEQNTAYYLLNISNPEGRNYGASHFAIHQFMVDNQQEVDLIDFEGSSIEGVKRFYKSFGAIEETYFVYKENRLPFFLKWFKKG